MIARNAANIKSIGRSGDITIPPNSNRSYFLLVAISAGLTLELGKGGGSIPLAMGANFEPSVCPTGEIKITSTGSYITAIG